jgi:hypothetical protein
MLGILLVKVTLNGEGCISEAVPREDRNVYYTGKAKSQ